MKPTRTPIKRYTPPKRSTKRIPRVNAKRKAKKSKAYKSFLSSAKWKALRKAALERAGFRCEGVVVTAPIYLGGFSLEIRCGIKDRLQVHHKHYSLRFGGNELPEDLEVLCNFCHRRVHAMEGKKIA